MLLADGGARGDGAARQHPGQVAGDDGVVGGDLVGAEEARDIGYLRQGDSVSMAREHLINDAKQTALGLARAGYRPPPPRKIRVIGETGAATLRTALHNLKGAHQITEHDATVSGHLVRVISGGAVPAGAAVSEQHILDLEREAFLSLCGEPKTRDRIQYMLQKSKPLRN